MAGADHLYLLPAVDRRDVSAAAARMGHAGLAVVGPRHYLPFLRDDTLLLVRDCPCPIAPPLHPRSRERVAARLLCITPTSLGMGLIR